MANTNIIPPRVDFIDPRTGKIAREWFMFFYELFRRLGGISSDSSITDLEASVLSPTPDLVPNPFIGSEPSVIPATIDSFDSDPAVQYIDWQARMESSLSQLSQQVKDSQSLADLDPPALSDHGALAGLTDDDHTQYLLASAATSRAAFATNWTDLTDGGTTTLHTHTSGVASSITLVDAAADTSTWVVLGTAQTGDVAPATDAGLTYNANTNALTATTFVGALNGNADTVTTNANLTGPITSTGNATAVAAQTGTGSTFVMQASPTLTTPNIGVASATSVTLGSGSALANYTTWATFTPTVTLVGGAGNTVPVYTNNLGRWMQIGKHAIANVELSGDGGAEGAGTGNLTITLPVAAGANTFTGYVPIGRMVNGASTTVLTGALSASSTALSLGWFSAATTHGLATGAEQNNTTRTINFQIVYEVD